MPEMEKTVRGRTASGKESQGRKREKQKAATEAITKAQEEVKRIRQEAEKAAEEAQNQLMAMQKEKTGRLQRRKPAHFPITCCRC